jgi:hypothetical protein
MGKIAQCTCRSEFQDLIFGKGKRYFNLRSKGGGNTKQLLGFRCTVCKKEIGITADDVKENKKEK